MFKKKEEKFSFVLAINKVIKVLIFSDLLIISGYSLISPIFALFIVDNIDGGNLEVVGIASAILIFAQSFFQIPFARIIDRIRGERDDFWAMFIGSLFYSAMPLFYFIVDTPGELYLVQFVYGVVGAITIPSWLAIFTRHIDKKHEGYDWSVYNTFVGVGTAAAASIGGFIAYRYGFAPLFITVVAMNYIGTFSLVIIYRNMKKGKIFGLF